jgi:hypothetical protein
MRTFAPSLVSLLVLFTACKQSEPQEPAAPAAQAAPASPEPAPTPPAKAAEPSAAPATPTGAAASGPTAGGLTWEAPKPFETRPPKSSMRVAEYGIEGDTASELGVFFFGADQGGSVDANMSRWIGQFTQPDGSETKSKRSERTVKGVDVSLVEAHGTFSGGMAMPGAPQPAAISDAMLLAAIAKGPGGPVFFKLVGPRASVEAARGAFDGLIESLRPTP